MIPKTAKLLIALIGEDAARRMMDASAYGGRTFYIPQLDTGRSDETFAALAERIGDANATTICKHFGGDRPYIPRWDAVDKAERADRNRRIVAAYESGVTVFDLVGEFNLSDRQIKTILKKTDMTTVNTSVIESAQQALF